VARICPSCSTENPDQARFCFGCGTALARQQDEARRERKFATALFADIVGSTRLTEREDPEVVRSLVARTFDRMAPILRDFGGTLERFVGDGMLGLFGVPSVHEDDPERAVRSALAMQAALSDLQSEFTAEGKPTLAMRIGIEAGEVLADLDRAVGSRDRIVTGDAVNTAARLQAAAEPGGVVVGRTVYDATKDAVAYRSVLPLALKGKSEPVPAWVALGLRRGGPRERAALGLEARLVGREEDLAILRYHFGRASIEGRPSLISVLGPAGVGKSRLAREFRRALDPDLVVWREGRCVPYGSASYSALASIMKEQCEIREGEPPGIAGEKADRAIEELFGDRELAPHLRALIGAAPVQHVSREELFDAWRRILERLASTAPLVLVLEDIHWSDDGLLDFVEHLADWGQGSILLLTLARPELMERRPTWGGGKRNYAAVYLDPLTPDETEAMMEDLLPGVLRGDLMRLVIERSGGNPLYGEEIVRMLIDRGVLRRDEGGWVVAGSVTDLEVPRSIHALVASRLDSLPEDEKAIVQDAAVVGHDFWLGAVEQLARRNREDVRTLLARLRIKEIVTQRDISIFSGESQFAFRHALIRDVAYESLPKASRADKHVAVARWAEERAGERSDEVAEFLATHYALALDYLTQLGEGHLADVQRQAFGWARLAGERTLRLWQQREAAGWFRRAAEIAERIGLPPGERAAIWEACARASEEVEAYPEVAKILHTALGQYEESGMLVDAGRIQARLSWIAFLSGREDDALSLAERALAMLEPLGDSRDLATALHVRGWYLFRRMRYDEAEAHLRRAIEITERVGDDVGRGHALISLAFVLQQTLRGEECLATFEEALALAHVAGDLSLLLRAQLHICGALQEFPGDLSRGELLSREGLELAQRAGNIGNIGWMAMMLSDMLFERGQLAEAESFARTALDASRSVGEQLPMVYALERLAIVHAYRGELNEAEALLPAIRAVVQQEPEPWVQGWMAVIEGLVVGGRKGEGEAAQVLLDSTGAVLERLFVYGGVTALIECVRTLARAGRHDEAAPFRARLAWLATASVPALAFLAWADGLLDSDARLLQVSIDRFGALGRPVEQGRVLLDLGELTGDTEAATRGREMLASCGATAFLRDGAPA
jgi:class 3 adenylate cyclase/tetratricopeptide (TPR) repeat protein